MLDAGLIIMQQVARNWPEASIDITNAVVNCVQIVALAYLVGQSGKAPSR